MSNKKLSSIADKYTYKVFWSPEDQAFIGTVAEFPSLSWITDSRMEALVGIYNLVMDVLEDLVQEGVEFPTPWTERKYSGKLNLRLGPDLHKGIACG